MTIKKMIERLIELGYTQGGIADAVGATQPTIHRALNGADIRYTTGKAIEFLYKQKLLERSDQPEEILVRRIDAPRARRPPRLTIPTPLGHSRD